MTKPEPSKMVGRATPIIVVSSTIHHRLLSLKKTLPADVVIRWKPFGSSGASLLFSMPAGEGDIVVEAYNVLSVHFDDVFDQVRTVAEDNDRLSHAENQIERVIKIKKSEWLNLEGPND